MSTPRMLVVPGGTSIGSVAMAYASLHKLVELYEERLADPNHPAPHTVAVLRAPELVPPSTLRGSAVSPREAFPANAYPELADRIDDPNFFDGIDLVLASSGSSTGTPRLVGLSTRALIASAQATHAALDGPGRWICALPAHHIAGAQTLLRASVAELPPQLVDTSAGFDPRTLLPAVAGATQDENVPGYLSLVPLQLEACLEVPEVTDALTRLSAVLVGGSGVVPQLKERARERGIRLVETYGMTETAGGCVYDGAALPGVSVRTVDWEGMSRVAVAGSVLFTRYLSGDAPFIDDAGQRWLLTADLGTIDAGGRLSVGGRADDVIISGGLNIAPGTVRGTLSGAPDVRDSWVLGLPDERWGQALTALVVPEAMPASAEEVAARGSAIRDYVGEVLGRAQAPRRVIFVDSFPQLASGKIDRLGVKALAEQLTGGAQEWRR